MYARVRVDAKGRITLPKEFREALSIREGDELLLSIRGNRIIVERCEDPFKVLEEVLGDLTFERGLRRVAEEEALRLVKERGEDA
ncbi:MAG: AbrB/MazE/SpoVT family DNA-binding domain-containing protein [Thermoproteales archaeon]|nr:AbrB/MazE/SpoVT family DNA-binding domain-containing protein [Thermoproteales archaeon]